MSLFSGILRDAQTAAIKGELKWLTGELGPARELDVLIKRVVGPGAVAARTLGRRAFAFA